MMSDARGGRSRRRGARRPGAQTLLLLLLLFILVASSTVLLPVVSLGPSHLGATARDPGKHASGGAVPGQSAERGELMGGLGPSYRWQRGEEDVSERLEGLIPLLGASYILTATRFLSGPSKPQADRLIQAVKEFRCRSYERTKQLVEQVFAETESGSELAVLSSKLLLNLGQILDHDDDVVLAVQRLPKNDTMARFAHAMLLVAQGKSDEYDHEMERLGRVSLATKILAEDVVSRVVLEWHMFRKLYNYPNLTYNGSPNPGLSQMPKDYRPTNVAIVTLGCPVLVDVSGSPVNSECLQERIGATLELAREIPEALVIASGGGVATAYPESEAIKAALENAGISPSRIVADYQARDTIGNAMNMMQILDRYGIRQVIMVTSAWHIPRALLCLKGTSAKAKADLQIFPYSAGRKLIVLPGTSTKSRALKERLQLEEHASYRDAARALGYFEPPSF